MKSFKKYLFHRIRSSAALTVVICLFSVIMASLFLRVRVYDIVRDYVDEITGAVESVVVPNLSVRGTEWIMIILCVLCITVPVLELSGLKNKRNSDTVYSLPIDRRKMGIAHFVNGYIQIALAYVCMFALLMIYVLRGPDGAVGIAHFEYALPLLVVPLAAALFAYSYFFFMFNEANTAVDGCAFVVAGTVVPIMIFLMLTSLENYPKALNTVSGLDVWPFRPIYVALEALLDGFMEGDMGQTDRSDIVLGLIWAAIGILSSVGAYMAFSRKRTEAIGDVSNSYIGYKVIIPISVFCVTAAQTDDFVIVIVFSIIAAIGYMLYRRSFKLRPIDACSVVGAVVAAYVIKYVDALIGTGGGAL